MESALAVGVADDDASGAPGWMRSSLMSIADAEMSRGKAAVTPNTNWTPNSSMSEPLK